MLVHDCLSDKDITLTSLTAANPTALVCDSALLRTGLQQMLRNTPFAIADADSVTRPKRLQYCSPSTALLIIEANRTRVVC